MPGAVNCLVIIKVKALIRRRSDSRRACLRRMEAHVGDCAVGRRVRREWT
jgi:hypothetical protein